MCMAHTLGMSIQQHQQKSLLKFYALPRAKTSRFPEKISEKRLKKPWVKVQVHRICQSPFWHLFVTPLKMGAKKPGSRSVSLYRDTSCHPLVEREWRDPLPLFLGYAGNGMTSLSGGRIFGCFSSGCMALSTVPMSR